MLIYWEQTENEQNNSNKGNNDMDSADDDNEETRLICCRICVYVCQKVERARKGACKCECDRVSESVKMNVPFSICLLWLASENGKCD